MRCSAKWVAVVALLALSRVGCQSPTPDLKTETKPEEKSTNATTFKPDTVDKEPETKSEPKPEPEPKPSPKTEPKPSPKPEPKPKSTPDAPSSEATKSEEDTNKLPSSSGCGAGCEICHEDHCFSCNGDYQRIEYKCQKKGCSDNRCKDCSADVCYKCVDGFAPDLDGVCKWIGPTGCQEKNCMLCEQTRIGCTECMPGFQLRSNRCFKNACKDKNCLRCNSNGKKCELCKVGFQSRLGECLEVGCLDDNCRQCSPSGGSCYRCIDGYYDDLINGTCKSCPDPNCVNCNGSQNSCVKCVDGYFVGKLPSGKVGCVECGKSVDNCDACSRDGEDCYSCSTGFYLEHGHCIECPANCAICKSPWLCDQCKDNHDLYSNGLCQPGKDASLKSNGAEQHVPGLILIAVINILLAAILL